MSLCGLHEVGFLFARVFLEGEDVTIDNGTFSWSAEGPPCLKR